MHRRPCWVEIDTRAFEHNYRLLAASVPAELLAVVKANAYGHGLALCGPAAIRAGARWLGVTTVEEGIEARALCPTAEILVISGPFPGQGQAAIKHRLTTVVWEPWHLAELQEAARLVGCGPQSVPIHLELETGMNRQGVAVAGLEALLKHLPADGPLKLDGLLTHPFAADEPDNLVTNEQLALVAQAIQLIHSAQLRPAWLNIGNSASILSGPVRNALLDSASNAGLNLMLRPGLALYGLSPEFSATVPNETPITALQAQLQPVLTWKTRVVSLRNLSPGQVVGYNGTFVATEPMRVALLAVGYADGLRRALSNRGSALIAGERAPIVGRISMDQTVVDVTDIPGVRVGDEAVLLGSQSSASSRQTISAEEHARLCETIPWEVFTSIAERVERVPV